MPSTSPSGYSVLLACSFIFTSKKLQWNQWHRSQIGPNFLTIYRPICQLNLRQWLLTPRKSNKKWNISQIMGQHRNQIQLLIDFRLLSGNILNLYFLKMSKLLRFIAVLWSNLRKNKGMSLCYFLRKWFFMVWPWQLATSHATGATH